MRISIRQSPSSTSQKAMADGAMADCCSQTNNNSASTPSRRRANRRRSSRVTNNNIVSKGTAASSSSPRTVMAIARVKNVVSHIMVSNTSSSTTNKTTTVGSVELRGLAPRPLVDQDDDVSYNARRPSADALTEDCSVSGVSQDSTGSQLSFSDLRPDTLVHVQVPNLDDEALSLFHGNFGEESATRSRPLRKPSMDLMHMAQAQGLLFDEQVEPLPMKNKRTTLRKPSMDLAGQLQAAGLDSSFNVDDLEFNKDYYDDDDDDDDTTVSDYYFYDNKEVNVNDNNDDGHFSVTSLNENENKATAAISVADEEASHSSEMSFSELKPQGLIHVEVPALVDASKKASSAAAVVAPRPLRKPSLNNLMQLAMDRGIDITEDNPANCVRDDEIDHCGDKQEKDRSVKKYAQCHQVLDRSNSCLSSDYDEFDDFSSTYSLDDLEALQLSLEFKAHVLNEQLQHPGPHYLNSSNSNNSMGLLPALRVVGPDRIVCDDAVKPSSALLESLLHKDDDEELPPLSNLCRDEFGSSKAKAQAKAPKRRSKEGHSKKSRRSSSQKATSREPSVGPPEPAANDSLPVASTSSGTSKRRSSYTIGKSGSHSQSQQMTRRSSSNSLATPYSSTHDRSMSSSSSRHSSSTRRGAEIDRSHSGRHRTSPRNSIQSLASEEGRALKQAAAAAAMMDNSSSRSISSRKSKPRRSTFCTGADGSDGHGSDVAKMLQLLKDESHGSHSGSKQRRSASRKASGESSSQSRPRRSKSQAPAPPASQPPTPKSSRKKPSSMSATELPETSCRSKSSRASVKSRRSKAPAENFSARDRLANSKKPREGRDKQRHSSDNSSSVVKTKEAAQMMVSTVEPLQLVLVPGMDSSHHTVLSCEKTAFPAHHHHDNCHSCGNHSSKSRLRQAQHLVNP